jgi:hypothetical protein
LSLELLKSGRFVLRGAECQLHLAFSRLPMFAELGRFPATYTEEKLIAGTAGPQAAGILTIAVPDKLRSVHLRGLAILGARLGQTGYFSDHDYRLVRVNLHSWTPPGGNLIVMGRIDEMAGGAVTNSFHTRSLQAGQGLLSERIRSSGDARALLVTGFDDAGLEKALLTLGDNEALASISPSPALVMQSISGPARAADRAGSTSLAIRLRDLGWDGLPMVGSRVERVLAGWQLAPGRVLESGRLALEVRHSAGLQDGLIEVLINGMRAGTVLLPLPRNRGTATIALPAVVGRDPMTVTFRTALNSRPFSSEEPPSLEISGGSILEGEINAAKTKDLRQVNRFLVPGPTLENLAFAAPLDCSVEELRTLFNLALYAGANVPSAAHVWPEASGYDSTRPAEPTRMAGKSAILLGAARRWKSALPRGEALPIEIRDKEESLVYMQGRRYSIADFEPSLTFLSLCASRWTPGNAMLTAGGWDTFATAGLTWMLTDAQSPTRVFGTICVMDERGRVATYDTLHPSTDSLGERIRTFVPAGVSAEETARRLSRLEDRAKGSERINHLLFFWFGGLLIFLLLVRLMLTWDQSRRRERVVHSQPAGAQGR